MSVEETRGRLAERARRAALALAAERERSVAEADRPLEPGDLFADLRTAELPLEWAVIAEESARLLVVPADVFPLRGPADVAVEAGSSTGPLTLRCAHGFWIEPARLTPAAPATRLPERAVIEAAERHRVAAGARGVPAGTPLEREAAIDPEYQYWVESVLAPARRAMTAAAASVDLAEDIGPAGTAKAGAPPAPVARSAANRSTARTAPPGPATRPGAAPPRPGSPAERRRRGSRVPLALAASVLLLVAVGLLAGIFRQRHQIAELRAAELDLRDQLAELSADRTDLSTERERLQRRLAGLDEKHRGELAARESAAEAVERRLSERIAELDRQLAAALRPRVWVGLPFALLERYEPTRGAPESVESPNRAQHFGILLQYVMGGDHPAYRIELHRGQDDRPLWTADDVQWNDALLGFVVILPGELLTAGEYRWEIFGAPDGGVRSKVAEYRMVVEGTPGEDPARPAGY